MFAHLTSRLRDDVDTVQRALLISDKVRDLILSFGGSTLVQVDHSQPGLEDVAKVVFAFNALPSTAPNKLDWQIYDHCAALTRLYAVYEQFVGELVGEYTAMLPRLYARYSDLPSVITKHHRIGIGQILLKMGEKGLYRKLEEEVVVQKLAAGLTGSPVYALLAEAFFVERQNLRFEVLCQLFSSLGFKHCGRYLNRHPDMSTFIRAERADSSSAEKELRAFIDYRNEAAHRKIDNVLGIDAIGSIGRFLVALSSALADMVEEGVLHRRMELNHYSRVLAITEIHYDGYVVIGIPEADIKIGVGDEILAYATDQCRRVKVESIQVDGKPVQDATGNGTLEIGLRLNGRVAKGMELRSLRIPGEVPAEVQLNLEDVLPPMADEADTDVTEPVEPEGLETTDTGEEMGAA